MAMRPRTNEDRNRLAAHVAAQPMVPYPTGGSEAQSELPNTQEYATEADAAALGVTVDDIRRMLSNPGRYGGIYKPKSAKDGIAADVKDQPAVDNAKRTTSRQKADGSKAASTTPLPPPRPSETGTASDEGLGNATQAAILAALGGAGAYGLKRYLDGRGTKTMPVEATRGADGDVLRLEDQSGRAKMRQLPGPVAASDIVDAEWADAPRVAGPNAENRPGPIIMPDQTQERALLDEVSRTIGAPAEEPLAPRGTEDPRLPPEAVRGPAPVSNAGALAPDAVPADDEITKIIRQEIARATKPKVKGKRF